MAQANWPEQTPRGGIDDKSLKDLDAIVKKHGMGKNLYEEMKKKRDMWRKEVINIAFIGQARQGKSSLINANLGQKLAKVRATGVCTTDIRSFPHPRNQNIVMWDVPGIDAVNYPREEYFEKIGYYEHNYDFFLIVTMGVFSSDAKYVADLVQNNNKRFYLVRTHIDDTIRNQRRDTGNNLAEEDIIAETRRNIEQELNTFAFDTKKFKLYLVSNFDPLKYDLPKLQKDICQDSVSELQQEALLLTIGGYGEILICLKYNMFQDRIRNVALASAAGGAFSINEFNVEVDLRSLIDETLLYFEGFGLSKESIATFEELNEVEKGTIENALRKLLRKKYCLLYEVREEAPWVLSSWDSIKTGALAIAPNFVKLLVCEMSLFAGSEVAESTAKLLLPFVGSIIGAGISYAVTSYQLNSFLDQMKEIALFVNSYLADAPSRRMEAFEVPEDE